MFESRLLKSAFTSAALVSALAASAASAARPTPTPMQQQIESEIERVMRYPMSAARRNETGIVEVSFRADGAGRPTKVRVARTSGWRSLDRAALDTIRRIGPLTTVKAGQKLHAILQFDIAAPEAVTRKEAELAAAVAAAEKRKTQNRMRNVATREGSTGHPET